MFTETAINIGYSCKLLTADMKVFIIDSDDKEGVRAQLTEAMEEMQRVQEEQGEKNGTQEDEDDEMKPPSGPPFGIVINGHSLVRRERERERERESGFAVAPCSEEGSRAATIGHSQSMPSSCML